MSALTLLATTLGLGFTAGLNLYATVLATGFALRAGWLTLPASLDGLRVLESTPVLAVAAVLFVVEFIADKIPFVEHAWDAVHTLVRPIGAVWIAWTAIGGAHLPPAAETALLLIVGGVSASTHLGKAGTRVLATSAGGHVWGLNAILSLLEDVVSFVVAPLALAHPIAALVIVAVVGTAFLMLAAKGYRYLRGTRRRAPSY